MVGIRTTAPHAAQGTHDANTSARCNSHAAPPGIRRNGARRRTILTTASHKHHLTKHATPTSERTYIWFGGELIWYEEDLPTGGKLRLAPLTPKTSACLEEADKVLREALHGICTPDTHTEGSVTAGEPTAQEPAAAEDAETRRATYRFDDLTAGYPQPHAAGARCPAVPTWHLQGAPCHGHGSCCEVTELGLLVGARDESGALVESHLDALGHLAGLLAEAGAALTSEKPPASRLCTTCKTDLDHARTLETAMQELSTDLAIVAGSFRLDVKVNAR